MEKKTTLTLWISPLKDPKGGIYRHQENGGQGNKSLLEVLAQRRQGNKAAFLWPYQGGARNAACCALPACHPVSCMSWFLDLGPNFDETTLQS